VCTSDTDEVLENLKMNRLKLHIFLLFFVALGTGILVGMGLSRTVVIAKPAATSTRPGGDRPSLTEALSLTAAQSEQLKSIWTDWDPSRQSRSDRHLQFQQQRDESVQALLTSSQKTAYEDLQKKYRQQLDALDEERKQSFHAAVEKTKAILTDTQRAKYEEILKNGPPSRSGRGGGGWDRGGARSWASSRHGAPPPESTPAATRSF
jgi:Spy/CpxP family protein refolding chaperone